MFVPFLWGNMYFPYRCCFWCQCTSEQLFTSIIVNLFFNLCLVFLCHSSICTAVETLLSFSSWLSSSSSLYFLSAPVRLSVHSNALSCCSHMNFLSPSSHDIDFSLSLSHQSGHSGIDYFLLISCRRPLWLTSPCRVHSLCNLSRLNHRRHGHAPVNFFTNLS